MENKCKRFLSLLLAFVMVLGMFPAGHAHVHAAEDTASAALPEVDKEYVLCFKNSKGEYVALTSVYGVYSGAASLNTRIYDGIVYDDILWKLVESGDGYKLQAKGGMNASGSSNANLYLTLGGTNTKDSNVNANGEVMKLEPCEGGGYFIKNPNDRFAGALGDLDSARNPADHFGNATTGTPVYFIDPTIDLIVGQSHTVTIPGEYVVTGNDAVGAEASYENDGTATLKRVSGKTHGADVIADGKYIFLNHRQNAMLKSTDNGLKIEGALTSNDESAVWTVVTENGNKYIKQGDKYLKFDASARKELSDTGVATVFTTFKGSEYQQSGMNSASINWWYVKQSDFFLSNYGNGTGVGGYDNRRDEGNRFFIYALKEGHTTVTFTAATPGDTEVDVGDGYYMFHVHTPDGDGTVREPATLQSAGLMEYTCSGCGATYNTVIPQLTAKNAQLNNGKVVELSDFEYTLVAGTEEGKWGLIHGGNYHVQVAAGAAEIPQKTGYNADLTIAPYAENSSYVTIEGYGHQNKTGFLYFGTVSGALSWNRNSSVVQQCAIAMYHKDENSTDANIPGYSMVPAGNIRAGEKYLIAAQENGVWYVMAPVNSNNKLDHVAKIVSAEPNHTHGYRDEITTPATCTTTGLLTKTCTDTTCGHVHKEIISVNANAHAWGKPVFTWSDGTAIATVTCGNDESHLQNPEVAVTSTSTTGDCQTKVVTTYTATVTFNGVEYNSTNEVTGAVNSNVHTYGTLIPAQPAVHTQTTLTAGVAAHYKCACGKYFTEGKVETSLAALTGETPKHDSTIVEKENEKAPTLNEQGSYDEVTYCSGCNKEMSRKTVYTGYAEGAVAEVGGIKYATLAEAIAVGGEVTLLADVALTEYLTVAKDVTLKLNGNNITGDFAGSYGMIYVKKGATLTVEGEGSIVADKTHAIGNYGTVIVEGGTISTNAGDDYAGLYNFYYQADWYGTSTIKGGSVASVFNCGELTVEGGEVAYLDNSGKLAVTGGTVADLYARDGSDAAGVEGAGTIAIADTAIVTVPDDYMLVEISEGVYQVVAKTYVAQIGDTKYESLAKAVEKAAAGDTVKLLKDANGDGIIIDKNITIDLGDFTYTINGTLVGSTGTKSCGFQILSGNTVTIKNGAIVMGEGAVRGHDGKVGNNFVIQNYANLTLENVAVTGNSNTSYVVSINSGDVAMTGNTSITAKMTGAVAFDVCKYASYAEPTVTVNTTGTIDGNIEVTGGELNIEAATINGALDYTAGKVTKADTVALNAPADYKWVNGVLTAKVYVAWIKGGNKYESLAEAVEAAKPGNYIALLADTTEDIVLDKAVTLELAGKTLNGQILVKAAATVIGGTVYAANKDAIIIGVKNDANDASMSLIATNLTVTSETDCAVLIYDGTATFNICNLNSNSTSYAAVQGSGNQFGNINLNSTTVTSANEVAIYWPHVGTLTTNGGAITGTTGLYIKQGTANLSNSTTITGNGAYADRTANGNGCDSTGDAITVDTGATAPAVNLMGVNLNSTNSNLVGIYGGTVNQTGGLNAAHDAFRIEAGTLNLNGGFVNAGECAVYIRGGDVNVKETNLTSTSTEYAAVQGNGTCGGNLTVNAGASITNANEVGIYWPGEGNLTVNGGVITGTTGIYAKQGNVTITDGTIKGTGAKADFNHNGNGGDATGDALVLESCDYGTLTATITGGTFESTNANAVAAYAQNGCTALTGFVSGGTFSTKVEESYCAEGYCSTASGENYIVRAHNAIDVAEVPATCGKTGTTAGTKCEYCGKILSGCTETPALKHEYTTYEMTRKPAADNDYVAQLTYYCKHDIAHTNVVDVELPEAVVTDIDAAAHGLVFAKQFSVDLENLSQPQIDAYAMWYADFVITFSKDVILNADGSGDGWLAGQYGEYNWINVPFETVTIKANEPVKIMELAAEMLGKPGLQFTAAEIFTLVQNFNCGVYLTPEYMAAHPGMTITLDLGLYEEKDTAADAGAKVTDSKIFTIPTVVAMIGNVGYATLAEAVAAAEPGATVTLLKDANGDGIIINKNITIDLNTYTYTIDGTLVGSTGTKSCGFQILSGNTVTIKNGAIVMDEKAVRGHDNQVGNNFVIQNYADLTLDNVAVTGNSYTSYVVSINSGDVAMTGNTSITAKKTGAVAFDVCKYASYTEPVVTVAETVTINGKVEAAAKVGNVYYATFEKALAAADGDIITLLAPVVITKDTNLDLTGKKLDGNGVYPAFRVQNGATLTIQGGEFFNATDYLFTLGASDKTSAGNLIIGGGSFKAMTTIASVTKGTLTVNGGSFECFDGEYGAAYMLNCYDESYKNGTAQIIVNGGTFVDFNPAANAAEGANTNFVAEGYISVENNGVYTVVEAKTVTWYDEDGKTILFALTVPASEVVTSDRYTETPTKAEDEQYTYEFAAWEAVEGGFKATYTATEKKPALFKLNGTTMTLGNTLDMNFFIKDEDVAGINGVYAVITKNFADGRPDVVVNVPYSEWKTHPTYPGEHYVKLSDLSAKEMTDEVTVVIYDGDNNAISQVWHDSIRDYAMRLIKQEEGKGAAANQKNLNFAVNMLNYGAAAQNTFKYNHTNLANLANSLLTAEQQEAYATPKVEVENKKTLGDESIKCDGATLLLQNRIQLNFIFETADVANVAYAKATYTNYRGVSKAVTIDRTEFMPYADNDLTGFYIPVADTAMADCRALITLKLYDANGNVISTTVDSVESYCARISAIDADPLYTEIMKLADSAYALFVK